MHSYYSTEPFPKNRLGLPQCYHQRVSYAEAWNQRAICHYHLQNWECVLWDVDRTLALEPRHFGALWGGIHACEQMKENYCEDQHLNYLERYTSLCKFDIDAQERLQTLQEKRSPIDVETIERSNPDR